METQTAGRGRLGRSFLSLKDKGIYFSILLRPKCLASDLKTITAWTAVAVARAIQRSTGCLPGTADPADRLRQVLLVRIHCMEMHQPEIQVKQHADTE